MGRLMGLQPGSKGQEAESAAFHTTDPQFSIDNGPMLTFGGHRLKQL
jgi:hypothetical protein